LIYTSKMGFFIASMLVYQRVGCVSQHGG
jgi:hypothetical protein